MKAKFIGDVVTKWLVFSRKMQLLKPFLFQDKAGKQWKVKKGAIVDGASIPRLVWSFIGSPFSGKYRRASVIHDVYCQTKSEPHKLVHKMFYQAMRVDKVNYFKAKAMYFAIRIGGPKW
ncbi:MAG: DUF1353 domain-containing protein [Colwellia sp.]